MIADPGPDTSVSRSGPLGVEVLGPTLLEYLTLRALRPGYRVRHAGMRLSRWSVRPDTSVVVVCGLAGSLVPDLEPGDVFIPTEISTANGAVRGTDAELNSALWEAARELGLEPKSGRLLTSTDLVTGMARAAWASRGFVAADMEAGLLPGDLRVTSVRVILDAPDRPISSAWASSGRAVLSRAMWSELTWLATAAPRYSLRAARVTDRALCRLDTAASHAARRTS